MKHSIQVTILDQQFSIRSEASLEEVRRVAAFVNMKISEVISGHKAVDTLDAVILALLNVAGAYLKDSRADNEASELEARLTRLLGRLEQACPELSDSPDGNKEGVSRT